MILTRFKAKVDDNQKDLVDDLKYLGYTVLHLHQLGAGAGDILVGANGINYMFEIKNPDLPPSKRRLTSDEKKFHDSWQGQIDVVETLDDVLNIIKE